MTRHLHLDPQGGIAGDMFVAAMLDACPELAPRVMADIAAVLPPRAGTPLLTRVVRTGISAGHFRLQPGTAAARTGTETTWAAMDRVLAGADTAPGTADHARAILRRLAEAESAIHAIPIERVHFHEIADWDALMDVTAAGSILAALPGISVSLAALPVGGGQIRTAHGLLNAPAPATLRLLQGFVWHDDGIEGERVTPTGAAILAHLMQGRHDMTRPAGRLAATGYGAGSRELTGVPNVLRATVFDGDAGGTDADVVTLLTCDIDDMTGEEIATAATHLRAVDGVRDLVMAALLGKKGRPVTRFELMVDPAARDTAVRALFTQTSTLGVRHMSVGRMLLERGAFTDGEGRPGKWTRRPDGEISAKIESDAIADLPSLAQRRQAGLGTPT